jgi:hypothetical protein
MARDPPSAFRYVVVWNQNHIQAHIEQIYVEITRTNDLFHVTRSNAINGAYAFLGSEHLNASFVCSIRIKPPFCNTRFPKVMKLRLWRACGPSSSLFVLCALLCNLCSLLRVL